MKNHRCVVGAVLAACGCVAAALSSPAAPEPASDDDPRADAKSSDQSLMVEDIVTAYHAADWARRVKPPSPFALVTAADVLHWYDYAFDGADNRFAERITPPKHLRPTNTDFLRDEVKKLMEEAVAAAAANKQDVESVRKVIRDVSRHPRGGLNMPLTFTGELPAGEADVYRTLYKRDEWARIAVRHAEDNIVDLHAADRFGHDRAADWARNPVISFLVRQGEGTDYKVTVRNARGSETITYQLFTN